MPISYALRVSCMDCGTPNQRRRRRPCVTCGRRVCSECMERHRNGQHEKRARVAPAAGDPRMEDLHDDSPQDEGDA